MRAASVLQCLCGEDVELPLAEHLQLCGWRPPRFAFFAVSGSLYNKRIIPPFPLAWHAAVPFSFFPKPVML
jgi:hypothetical protein